MSSWRQRRTRTLIQLGGLVEKSGLLDTLNLTVGDDLQNDPHALEPVAIFLGLLVQNSRSIASNPAAKSLALATGKQAFFEGG